MGFRSTNDQDFLHQQLAKIPFLREFDKKHIAEILQGSVLQHFQPEETIIPERSCEQWIYILLSGVVSVWKNNQQLALLDHPGDIFGELAMLSHDPREASVVANTTASCLAIDLTLANKLPEQDRFEVQSIIYRLLAEVLASRIKSMNFENSLLRKEIQDLRQFSHNPFQK